MTKDTSASNKTPPETSNIVAGAFFGVTDEASRQRAMGQLLIGAVESAVLVPLLFFLRFGEVDPLGWGITVFFVVYCLLAALGLHFGTSTAYHTQVQARGDWADRIGAFWLVACALGPFIGWIITSAFPITLNSWRWLYGLRFFFAAGLPLITALPLTRYLRGKATLIALPLLVVITLLPVWTVANISRDLWAGPVSRSTGLYLQHTDQELGSGR